MKKEHISIICMYAIIMLAIYHASTVGSTPLGNTFNSIALSLSYLLFIVRDAR